MMRERVADIEPIMGRSLKDEFIERFETLVLSGRFVPGERVPSERDLGTMFGVSRPVVHEGLRALESRGLVTIESRKGVRINDYRREGSIEMLLSILNFSGGRLSPALMDGVLEMRLLFETETARLAARRHGEADLAELRAIVERGKAGSLSPAEALDVDYAMHLGVAIASGNQIYPLLMNSFRRIYRAVLETFFSDPTVLPLVFSYHAELVDAIASRDEKTAESTMVAILRFGEAGLRRSMQD